MSRQSPSHLRFSSATLLPTVFRRNGIFFVFLGGDCGFFGRVGFKIVIGSIFGISWPASAATNFAFNKGTCNKMSKRPSQ